MHARVGAGDLPSSVARGAHLVSARSAAYIPVMEAHRPLRSVADDVLLRRLAELTRDSRRVEVDLVAHIGEVDARRLFAREATPSMFVYCTERLHLSEAEAYLRIAAARASREHPELLVMLGDGRLHLSGIARLAPHLTLENRDVVLRRAAHRSKRELEELVAELAPRPDAAAAIRKLPGRSAAAAATRLVPDAVAPGLELSMASGSPSPLVPGGAVAPAGDGGRQLVPDAVAPTGLASERPLVPDAVAPAGPTSAGQLVPDGVDAPAPGAALVLAAPTTALVARSAAPGPAAIEPLSPARYRVQFTASAALREKLERLQALMRSTVPDGDLAAIVEAAVTEKLERIEARRFGSARKPRAKAAETARHASAPTRHVPAAVRRAVRERDGERCGFVDGQGRRCTARERLEFHHRHPYGLGGSHELANVGLLCRAHNAHVAEADYGLEAGSAGRRASAVGTAQAGG